MFLYKHKFACSFSSLPSLLLAVALLFPLRSFGADQIVTQSEQPASQPVQSVPLEQQDTPQSVSPEQQDIPRTKPPKKPVAPQTKPPAQVERPSDGLDFVDAPRNYMSEKIISFTNYMDRFFGVNRHYQESNQSVFQLDLTRLLGYGGNDKFELSGKLSLRLPGTEGRLRLWLETDPENDISDDPTRDTHTLKNKDTTTKSSALAARYITDEEEAWRFSSDAGVKFPITQLNPFVRLKGEYSTPVGEWRMKVAESVYWFNTIGVGETTQLDLDSVISPTRLFRSSSNATWLKDTHNFDLIQSFSIYHTLSNRSALIYQASTSWVTSPSFHATDYVVLVYHRYRLHRKWLFLELSPQLHFPMAEDYKASPAFTMRLEALFDESK